MIFDLKYSRFNLLNWIQAATKFEFNLKWCCPSNSLKSATFFPRVLKHFHFVERIFISSVPTSVKMERTFDAIGWFVLKPSSQCMFPLLPKASQKPKQVYPIINCNKLLLRSSKELQFTLNLILKSDRL